MSTMYERIDRLCKDNGTNVTAMYKELEIARSSLSELNSGRSKTLSAEKTAKIASYFGVSVDYLLGNEPKEKTPTVQDGRSVSDDDIMFALWGDAKDVDKDDLDDVKRYAAFVRERKNKK